jgi:hypothetical protein
VTVPLGTQNNQGDLKMALQLAKELESGLSYDYHKIDKIVLDYKGALAHVYLASYASQALRASGKSLVANMIKQYDIADFLGAADDRAVAYPKLKLESEMAGASDV